MNYVCLNDHRDRIIEELRKKNIIMNPEMKKYIKEYGGPFHEFIKENVKVAEEENLPICQDTGMIEFFVFLPYNVCLDQPLQNFFDSIVSQTYLENDFRYSTVIEPIGDRKNANDNSPAIVHIIQTDDHKIEIKFLVKGGGSENLSALFMMKPSVGEEEIMDKIVQYVKDNGARGCPPLNIGIGIGGTSEKATLLSKLALLEPFEKRNIKRKYRKMEEQLLERINRLNIGFQGLGEGITAYSVHIKEYPTHIAILPLALAFDCYISRKGCVQIEY